MIATRLSTSPSHVLLAMLLVMAAYIFTGCAPTMKGEVKEDISITEQTKRLEEVGFDYRGPQYTVAILRFENKTPSKVLGIGKAATDILRTNLKKAGLEPILLSEEEMRDQERLIELQQTGAVKVGRKDASAGFESVDYRISGSITAYSEVDEGVNYLIGKTRTRIARVQVDYALVDVASGISLVAESGTGVYKKRTREILGFGGKSTADPGLRDGALRDALSKAMTSMIEKLNAQPFRGKVLLIEGDTIVIRAGTKSRIDPGTILNVYRSGKELVDPDTGRVIGRREKLIGEIVLSSHQSERISEASIKSGTGFKAGDVVKVLIK
jgi:curli biogenesis system outer membrane secretion channel CsgG